MPSTHKMTSIGVVASPRTEPLDDDWGDIVSTIRLDAERFSSDVVAGLDDFSHIDVVYVFDRVDEANVNLGSRHPRNRRDWPLVGIFAQRAKARPNRIGVTTCELLSVDGLTITVRGLDAIDASPVLDIKPHVNEFGPRSPVRQPDWIGELMENYWHTNEAAVADRPGADRPVLDQINLVVRDMSAAADFYRRLGMKMETTAPPWDEHHRTIVATDGLDFDLDSQAFATRWNRGWSRGKVGPVIGFRVNERDTVDAIYADLTGAGYLGQQTPYDAFWGARYAVVEDPDGNAIGIMSAADPARRTLAPDPY